MPLCSKILRTSHFLQKILELQTKWQTRFEKARLAVEAKAKSYIFCGDKEAKWQILTGNGDNLARNMELCNSSNPLPLNPKKKVWGIYYYFVIFKTGLTRGICLQMCPTPTEKKKAPSLGVTSCRRPPNSAPNSASFSFWGVLLP